MFASLKPNVISVLAQNIFEWGGENGLGQVGRCNAEGNPQVCLKALISGQT